MSTGDLVAKKGTTSFVWNFFGVKKDDDSDKDTAVCRLCRKSVLARGGNTSNLTIDSRERGLETTVINTNQQIHSALHYNNRKSVKLFRILLLVDGGGNAGECV